MNNIVCVLVICVLHAVVVSGTVNICYYYKKNAPELSQNQLNEHLKMNDSIYLGTQRVNFTHPAISLDILFDNLTVSHLSNIKLSPFNEQKQILNLTFPYILFEGEYDLKGNIGDLFDIFGKGHFRGRFIDTSLALTLDVFFNSSSICVPATVDLRIGKVMINFSHFMGDKDLEKLMNKGFSSILPEIIRVFWKEIKEGNDPAIEEWINSIINRNPAVSSVIEKLIQDRSQNPLSYKSFLLSI